jgi:hypothetical protein
MRNWLERLFVCPICTGSPFNDSRVAANCDAAATIVWRPQKNLSM